MQRIKNFAAFLGRSPDTASLEDVRRYQLHLASLSPAAYRVRATSLKAPTSGFSSLPSMLLTIP
ncbi:hypothetical protein ACWAUC_11625 [Bradyrhizobium guangdongense]